MRRQWPHSCRESAVDEAEAAALGFTREGLDTHMLEDTAKCARSLAEQPTDELFVESFVYYLEHDRPPST